MHTITGHFEVGLNEATDAAVADQLVKAQAERVLSPLPGVRRMTTTSARTLQACHVVAFEADVDAPDRKSAGNVLADAIDEGFDDDIFPSYGIDA